MRENHILLVVLWLLLLHTRVVLVNTAFSFKQLQFLESHEVYVKLRKPLLPLYGANQHLHECAIRSLLTSFPCDFFDVFAGEVTPPHVNIESVLD